VAVHQVLHTVMLAPPKFGTHGSFDGLPASTTLTLETIVRVSERKNSKVLPEDDGLSTV
jgi:hypothetical protein